MDPQAPAAADNVMMICPNLKCRKVLQVSARYRGQQVKCHNCGTLFLVPAQKKTDKSAAGSPTPGEPA